MKTWMVRWLVMANTISDCASPPPPPTVTAGWRQDRAWRVGAWRYCNCNCNRPQRGARRRRFGKNICIVHICPCRCNLP
ncbi:hypothetical protein M758_4G133100 [Ceratodon purpureus]|nr:hypothetical protein M758_4G133100 [Ceratodon purpureus]